jgi:hypothetical protein
VPYSKIYNPLLNSFLSQDMITTSSHYLTFLLTRISKRVGYASVIVLLRITESISLKQKSRQFFLESDITGP